MRFAVTPYAGVWIEIGIITTVNTGTKVTPYAGVWIEIATMATLYHDSKGHSLRGSVD